MLIGYARVSTEDQHLDLQHDALRGAGCEKVFDDKRSGAKSDRPGLIAALDYARSGDQLVVWRLDRLGRSLPDLIALVRQLDDKGVQLQSVTEGIDTSTIWHPDSHCRATATVRMWRSSASTADMFVTGKVHGSK